MCYKLIDWQAILHVAKDDINWNEINVVEFQMTLIIIYLIINNKTQLVSHAQIY